MRTSKQTLHTSIKKQLELNLAQVISDISDKEKAHIFLKDFLTEAELDALSKRLAVGYWLKKKRSYENIKGNLKVSSSTISWIQSNLNNKGFQNAIKLLEADEWANVWSERIKRVTKRHKD